MHLFFLMQNLQLLVFCMDGREFVATIVFLYIFSCNFTRVSPYIHFFIFGCLNNSALHTIPGPRPYGYEMIPSRISILLSSLALRAILLTFSVNTLCASHLNLCWDFNIVLLLFRHSL